MVDFPASYGADDTGGYLGVQLVELMRKTMEL